MPFFYAWRRSTSLSVKGKPDVAFVINGLKREKDVLTLKNFYQKMLLKGISYIWQFPISYFLFTLLEKEARVISIHLL